MHCHQQHFLFCILDSTDKTYKQQEKTSSDLSASSSTRWAWMRDHLWLQSKPTRTPISALHPGKYSNRHRRKKERKKKKQLFPNSFESTFREDAELIISSTLHSRKLPRERKNSGPHLSSKPAAEMNGLISVLLCG